MEIVAIFTCRNRKDKTEKAIRTIVNGNTSINFSFVVVDDNSTDGTTDMLQLLDREGIQIVTLHGDGNLYYSGGMRVAMEYLLSNKKSNYDYILMMNDDVEFYLGSIEMLVQESRKKTGAVIVGVTCDINGDYSYGAIQYTNGISYVGRGIEYSDTPCDTFNANCVLIPYEDFIKTDGMDYHYVHGLGDFDFGLTLKRNGARIYPSQEYIGVCNPNNPAGSWKDPNLPIIQRIKKKESPKGLPVSVWFYFIKKNFGFWLAVKKTITPYIRIFIGK